MARPPGIGKTTLAKLLVADAVNDEFEPVQVSADIEEGNSVITASQKQVFYYDDFLGETFLDDRLTKNEDKRLAAFIRNCANSPGKLFVLTTREHVFNQAMSLYAELGRAGAPLHKFVLRLETYSRYERARIFYNHVWHSGQLSAASREALVDSRSYLRIVDHPNYNPRLIEYITGLASRRLTDADKADYVGFAIHILDHPDEIWRQAFDHQLDGDCRDILIALASLPPLVANADLNEAFLALAAARGSFPGHGAYRSALSVLDDSFTRSQNRDGNVFISFANPSIRDFVTEWLAENSDAAFNALSGTIFFDQLHWFNARVAPSLTAEARRQFETVLATMIDRLWTSADPRWHNVHWGDSPEPIYSRRWGDKEERLEFVCEITSRSPRLAKQLEDWFDQRLDEIRISWAQHVANARNPVRLVKALAEHGRLDKVTFDSAADALEGNNSGLYQWDNLNDLDIFKPVWFGDARRDRMREAFKEWLDDTLQAPDEIRDEDQLYELTTLAENMGVDVDQVLVENADAEISSRRRSYDADADDGDGYDRSYGAGSSIDEGKAIDVLFERLNDF